MELRLERINFAENYTEGKLYDGNEFLCDTLEPKYRDLSKEAKVMGKTAIPYGKYEITVSLSAGFGRRLPLLLKVPHFVGIRIHSGNYPKHSEGCILVGEKTSDGILKNSAKTENRLTGLFTAELNRNKRVWIELCEGAS